MIPPEYVKKFRKQYALLIVGAIFIIIGFIILVFVRPYAFDSSQRDLAMVFAIMALLPGGALIIVSGIFQIKLWREAHSMKLKGGAAAMGAGYPESWVQPAGYPSTGHLAMMAPPESGMQDPSLSRMGYDQKGSYMGGLQQPVMVHNSGPGSQGGFSQNPQGGYQPGFAPQPLVGTLTSHDGFNNTPQSTYNPGYNTSSRVGYGTQSSDKKKLTSDDEDQVF